MSCVPRLMRLTSWSLVGVPYWEGVGPSGGGLELKNVGIMPQV